MIVVINWYDSHGILSRQFRLSMHNVGKKKIKISTFHSGQNREISFLITQQTQYYYNL